MITRSSMLAELARRPATGDRLAVHLGIACDEPERRSKLYQALADLRDAGLVRLTDGGRWIPA